MNFMQSSVFLQKIKNLEKGKLYKNIKMMFTERVCNEAREIFKTGVKAVKPKELIRRTISLSSNTVSIQNKSFPVNKNVYVVGFGKAVLEMASALEELMSNNIVYGIISIPEGIQREKEQGKISNIQVYEGASNNIPDEKSLVAASKIMDLVKSLDESDLLFVLISGGGSALLPAPKPPLTLQEKQKVITMLAAKGATIEEINIVRKRLSLLKGGGLAQMAKPAQVVSLILSDIIGDPLSLIASGPTVENTDELSLPFSIIEYYDLKDKLPQSAIQLLTDIPLEMHAQKRTFDHVSNFIIGNNKIALQAAALKAGELQYVPIILTNELRGIACHIGPKLIEIVRAALQQQIKLIHTVCEELKISTESEQCLLNAEAEARSNNKDLCILCGGETTVEIQGTGKGGRNQELALATAVHLNKNGINNIMLLSAGTDGIDGPTSAAGAIAISELIDISEKEGINALNYLYNNDSYTFYSRGGNSRWHVVTGHTGTNVMDILVILAKVNIENQS